MLTIARLGPGARSADYYLERRAGCEADYYTGEGDRPGSWCGEGARAAGLVGGLAEEGEQAFRGLLAGCGSDGQQLVAPVLRADPRGRLPARPLVEAVTSQAAERGVDVSVLLGDEQLADSFAALGAVVATDQRVPRRPRAAVPADLAGRIAAAAGLDPHELFRRDGADLYAATLPYVDARVDVRRAGLDLTFSAPKSVSVLFALGDSVVVRELRDAHRAAVEQTLAYLEPLCARAMRGHNHDGHPPRIDTDGWLAVAFEHVSSRSDDPQLHTHVVVPNVVHGADGRWSAFDTREVYRQALTGGYLYQAVLRGELTRRLGVQWGRVRRGTAEIEGVPTGLRRLFSTRRGQIVERLEKTGGAGPKAAQAATLHTRTSKTHRPEPILREEWAASAREAGFDGRTIVAGVLNRGVQLVLPGLDELSERVLSARGVTERRSSFDRRDLLRAVCESVPAGAPVTVDDLRAFATSVVRDPRVIPLVPGAPATVRRYSTADLLATEQSAVWAAGARGDDGLAAVDPSAVEGVLAGAGLSAEQAAMVRRVTESGAGVEVVVGPAGAGKTAALAAARRAWTSNGVPVRGAALAAIAARTLEDGAGIPSSSLTRLLHALDRGVGGAVLPPGGVLVVDEAGMVATRQLAHLIDLTTRTRTKLVLVGDPAQLPELEAGGLFAALTRALPAVRLAGNLRQHEPWERDALTELRDGDVLTALAAYRDAGRLHVEDDTTTVRTKLVDAYLTARDTSGPDGVLMLTSTRADARTLNRLTRAALVERGALTGDAVAVSVRGRAVEFRVGDAVVVTVNDYTRGLYNGSRGTVTGVDRHGLRLRSGDREVALPREWLATGVLEHGYALTCHRAQGVTVDVALLYASRALSREAGYVGLSRGRVANHLFATWEALVPQADPEADGPGEPPVAATERDELTEAALVERLETRTAQRLATEQAVGTDVGRWWQSPDQPARSADRFGR